MQFMNWYDQLTKPSWTPSPETIGLIWRVLYPIILVVNVWAFVQWLRGNLPLAVMIPLWVSLVLSLLFTPVQFDLRNLVLATIVIIGVWITIILSMIMLWPYSKLASLAFLPYLIWVTAASVLQISITIKN